MTSVAIGIGAAIVALEIGYWLGASDRPGHVIGSWQWWRAREGRKPLRIQGARATIQRYEDAARGDLWAATVLGNPDAVQTWRTDDDC